MEIEVFSVLVARKRQVSLEDSRQVISLETIDRHDVLWMIIHTGVSEVESLQVSDRSSLDGLWEFKDRSPRELRDLGEVEGDEF